MQVYIYRNVDLSRERLSNVPFTSFYSVALVHAPRFEYCIPLNLITANHYKYSGCPIYVNSINPIAF